MVKNIVEGGQNALRKSLSLLYVYALATGAIFTFMCYWDGIFLSYCGPATFLAYIMMTLMCLPIAYVYAELSTMLPSAGSSLVFNTIGLNKHAGFWSSWLIMCAWIAVPAAGTLGIIDWINFQFNLGWSDGVMLGIGVVSLLFWFALSMLKNVIAGKVQTYMLFSAIGGIVLTSLLLFFSGSWSLANFGGFFSTALGGADTLKPQWIGWCIGAAFLITPYFGFETVPALVEEGTFPIHDQKKAILGSVLTCGIIYAIFYFAVAGVMPWAQLTNNGDCSPFVSIKAFLTIFPGWTAYALLLGVVGVLLPIATSVLGFWYSGVRMIYAMGRQNFLPKAFSYTNKHAQPILPNLLILGISILFIMMQSIRSFFDLMAFACALCYAISTISSMALAKKHPEWKRPFVLPWGNVLRWISLAVSIVIAFFCTIGITPVTWFGFIGYMGVGLLLWGYMLIFKWRKDKVWMKTPDGDQEY
ncbi:MAG: APC family permease [Candidatus Margulisbacteria bacterium]|jgi:APA family basic amino acid/polyamine antiporter|nr:APC family permease [Candidatus Margulisiibacteriota bacterium]